MARPTKRGKAIDKWKLKKRFEVVAPEIFNNVPVGPIFAREAAALEGRTVYTTLSKLVNSNQHHIKIKLRVTGTQGFTALTMVKEVELARAYINSQTSVGRETIENVVDVITTDGRKVRIKTIIFTKKKCHSDQKKALRKLAEELIRTGVRKMDYDRLVQEVVFGKLGSLIFNKGKKIVPISRVEIRKLELLS